MVGAADMPADEVPGQREGRRNEEELRARQSAPYDVVAADELDREPKDGVRQQIDLEEVALDVHARAQPPQQREHAQLERDLIKEGWVARPAVVEGDGPRHPGGRAGQLGEEAPPAADR